MSKLVPVNDHVIIKPDEMGNETEGGIILPDAAKKRPETGRVLAVGARVKEKIAAGDRVLYDIEAGIDVETDGVKCLLMPERYVYGILGA